MDSNMIAIYLIAIICIGGGMFYFLRKYLKLSKLNKAIMEKKYDQILEMTEEPSVRKILSEFTADYTLSLHFCSIINIVFYI